MTANNNDNAFGGTKRAGEIRTRVVRGKPADRQFDIEFWQAQGDDAIFAAVWEMICMVEEEKNGTQPIFQRDATTVKRSPR
jgi:hypothetical protein